MTLIRRDAEGTRVVEDTWRAIGDEEPLPSEGELLVSLERFRRDREALFARGARVGVRVPVDADADAVAGELIDVALVAIPFPKFSDGRGYSLARILRSRGRYGGELRAVGHVLRDQLAFMARCGFTTFELAPGRDVGDALRAFDDFSVTYQPAEDHDEPIWRRRAAL